MAEPSKMMVDIRERGKLICTCSLDTAQPGAKIEFTGPKADAIRASMTEGYTYREGGKDMELKLGEHDLTIMTSLFKIMSNVYIRASTPYFEGEKPQQVAE